MAITHTNTVSLMEVLTANSDNIVGQVVVNIASSDDSNASKYKWDGSASFVLNTTGITTSTSGFVAYESLTESTVLGWVSSGISTCQTKTDNETRINELIAQDNRTTVDKALPWQATKIDFQFQKSGKKYSGNFLAKYPFQNYDLQIRLNLLLVQ